MLFGSEQRSEITIDDIVARAGVAKGTFYNHFVDKADIGNLVAARIRQDIRRQIEPAKIGSSDPALHLAIAISIFLSEAQQKPHRARVMISYLADVTNPENPMNAPLRNVLISGTSEGRFNIHDLDSALTYVIGIVSAGMLSVSRESEEKALPVAKHLVELMLTGLGVPRGDIASILARVPR